MVAAEHDDLGQLPWRCTELEREKEDHALNAPGPSVHIVAQEDHHRARAVAIAAVVLRDEFCEAEEVEELSVHITHHVEARAHWHTQV